MLVRVQMKQLLPLHYKTATVVIIKKVIENLKIFFFYSSINYFYLNNEFLAHKEKPQTCVSQRKRTVGKQNLNRADDSSTEKLLESSSTDSDSEASESSVYVGSKTKTKRIQKKGKAKRKRKVISEAEKV